MRTHNNLNISDETCQAFAFLFRGREDAWGGVEGVCHHEQVTPDHYLKHLKGETSLGIYSLLDDGTCHFVAVDLDVKDFNKAKAIRDSLNDKGLFSYIAESKSKGYHIFCFALDRFNTKDIRRILLHTLNTLKIKAEIFPKQDEVTEIIPLGNYINLPVHGYTRKFITGDLKEVPLEIAIERIKRIPNETIVEVLKGIPITEEPPKKEKKAKSEQKRHPQCIDAILDGVNEGQRDEAAFALARYYLDELKYTTSDTLGLLQLWDERNKPPLGKQTLDTKVKSAEKGYEFGCGTIRDKAILKEFCVGEEECEWWKEVKGRRERDRYLIFSRNAKGEVTSVTVDKKALIEDLKEEFIFKSVYGLVRDDILVYDSGVYNHNGEDIIRQECETRVPPPYLTTHVVHEVRDRIAGTTKTENGRFNTSKYIINLENGLLNVETRELMEHTPDFLSTIRIPITYNPQAKCPKITKFFREVLKKDGVKVVIEFFGYSLIPDYSIPVVLILYGQGGNGKSQIYQVLKNFIGGGNHCAVSIRNLKDYPFTIASLEGKLLNIQGDLSGGWFQDMNSLKMLTGEDRVEAPRKYKDNLRFDNYARLTFATNEPPIIPEDTLAIWRRMLMIDCPNTFEPSDEGYVASIGNVISTPEELSGLLNLALDGLERVLKNKTFTYGGTYKERARHYTVTSDPARVFVDECCIISDDARILKDRLYQEYCSFCEENSIKVKGEAQFGKELRQVPGISIGDKQYMEEGVRVRWWLGIMLKPVKSEPENEEEVETESEFKEPNMAF